MEHKTSEQVKINQIENVDAYSILKDIYNCVLSAGSCRIVDDEQFQRIRNYISSVEANTHPKTTKKRRECVICNWEWADLNSYLCPSCLAYSDHQK